MDQLKVQKGIALKPKTANTMLQAAVKAGMLGTDGGVLVPEIGKSVRVYWLKASGGEG
jgi:hypothetical protein